MSPFIHFRYAVYLLPGHPGDPLARTRRVIAKKYPTLKLVDTSPQRPVEQSLSLQLRNVQPDFQPPNLDTLQYFGHGLSPEESANLQRPDQAIIFDFSHPKEKVWQALYDADALLDDIAQETVGLPWDEETREVYSVQAWHSRRLAKWQDPDSVPDVSSQTVVHVYPNDTLLRAVSLGMSKMGLPDIVVEDVPRASENQAGNLINILGQMLAEGAPIDTPLRFPVRLSSLKNVSVRDREIKSLKKGAHAAAVLTLIDGRHDEGDPDNRLIQITFDAYDGSDLNAKQERAFRACLALKILLPRESTRRNCSPLAGKRESSCRSYEEPSMRAWRRRNQFF